MHKSLIIFLHLVSGPNWIRRRVFHFPHFAILFVPLVRLESFDQIIHFLFDVVHWFFQSSLDCVYFNLLFWTFPIEFSNLTHTYSSWYIDPISARATIRIKYPKKDQGRLSKELVSIKW